MRRVLLSLLPLLLLGLLASPASATTVDDVVSSLKSNPVYNDPEAENALTDVAGRRPQRSDRQQRLLGLHRDPAGGGQGRSHHRRRGHLPATERRGAGHLCRHRRQPVPLHVPGRSDVRIPATAEQRGLRGPEPVRHERGKHRQRGHRDHRLVVGVLRRGQRPGPAAGSRGPGGGRRWLVLHGQAPQGQGQRCGSRLGQGDHRRGHHRLRRVVGLRGLGCDQPRRGPRRLDGRPRRIRQGQTGIGCDEEPGRSGHGDAVPRRGPLPGRVREGEAGRTSRCPSGARPASSTRGTA